MSFEIKDLCVEVNGKLVLKDVNLKVDKGEVHVLMGPNGAGKSSLGYALMGHPKYKIVKGGIFLDDIEITSLNTSERAKLGLFLGFQYPTEISGVSVSNFLRSAYNSVKKDKLEVIKFHKLLKEEMDELKIDHRFIDRSLNEGFSGGEKKKAEILQMMVLKPKYCVLDECDSGLDVEAIKLVGKGINSMKDSGILLITHYSRILDFVKTDKVSVMINGRIDKIGGVELVKEIEKKGFKEELM